MVRHMILTAGLLVLVASALQARPARLDHSARRQVVASRFVVSWHRVPDATRGVVTYRLGCRVDFFEGRFFVEPLVVAVRWPVRADVPESFWTMAWWPSDVVFEPGLHLGVRF